MALTITKLKMWKDPKYTRGCLEIPPAGSKKLPTPDYTSGSGETLRPRKGSTLTSLELPLYYTQVFDMSYLYIEASDGAGTVSLFGWIDSVTLIATSNDAVRIDWSVDWWRSYSGSAVFGRARVTHCADSSYKRPYRVEPRKWKVDKSSALIPGDRTYPYNVVIVYNDVENKAEEVTIMGGASAVAQWTETHIQYVFWECNLISGKDTVGGVSNPSLRDIFTGDIDEMLGINPETITGIYILPFLGWTKYPSEIIQGSTPGTRKFAYRKTNNIASATFNLSLLSTYESNDYKRAIVIDPNGSVVATIPWGFSADKIIGYADIGTVGGSLHTRFALTNDGKGAVQHSAEGLSADLPALTCPVNSNAWSSYVYSGKRDYEIKMKETQRTTKAIEGVVSGGLIGSILSKDGKFTTTGIGAGAGAASSLLFSKYTDDKLQELTDQYYSNQSSNILIGGGGEGFSYTEAVGDWYMVQLVADDVSQDEYDDNVALNGYETDMTLPSVNTLITTGGAFSCTDLVITGNIPPQAKQEIKVKLENGVYIVENNPNGVIP